MSYLYIKTRDTVYSGPLIASPVASISSPYNFLSNDSQNLHSTANPFSLILTTVDPDSDTPYRTTIISPAYYLYIALDQELYRTTVLNRGQHQHNTYEIIYTREGEFYQQIEARRYKYTAQSCCLLNRNIRHKEEYTTKFSVVNLSLSADFLKDLFTDRYESYFSEGTTPWLESEELKQFFDIELQKPEQVRKSYLNFNPYNAVLNENDVIHDMLDQLAQILIAPTAGGSFLIRRLICQILCQLSEQKYYSTNLINLGTETESKVFSQVTQLMEATHGRINRKELIAQLNYSGNYLNKIVQKYTGMSILQYGNYFTMQQAAWLLSYTDMTVSQIIMELGIVDRTHFYQLFQKEFGETPRQFRNSRR